LAEYYGDGGGGDDVHEAVLSSCPLRWYRNGTTERAFAIGIVLLCGAFAVRRCGGGLATFVTCDEKCPAPMLVALSIISAGDRTVNSFTFVGAAAAKQSFVRLTPDLKEHFGSVFSRLSGRFTEPEGVVRGNFCVVVVDAVLFFIFLVLAKMVKTATQTSCRVRS